MHTTGHGTRTIGRTFMEAACCCRRANGDPSWMQVAVYFGDDPRPTAAGVAQTRCVFCGECLLGFPGSASFAGNVNARNLPPIGSAAR